MKISWHLINVKHNNTKTALYGWFHTRFLFWINITAIFEPKAEVDPAGMRSSSFIFLILFKFAPGFGSKKLN